MLIKASFLVWNHSLQWSANGLKGQERLRFHSIKQMTSKQMRKLKVMSFTHKFVIGITPGLMCGGQMRFVLTSLNWINIARKRMDGLGYIIAFSY